MFYAPRHDGGTHPFRFPTAVPLGSHRAKPLGLHLFFSLSATATARDAIRSSHQQIDAACAGFPESAIVGRGGFGPVFKGRFMGKDVAVKRLDGYGLQGLPNFLREVQVRLDAA